MVSTPGDLKELLSLAIYNEEAAKDLYSRLAKSIKNPEGVKTFERLAGDEGQHRIKLEGWYKGYFSESFQFDPAKMKRFEYSLDAQADALDALNCALDAEKKAAENYTAMGENAPDEEFADLCSELAEQEWGHFETLNAEIQAVTNQFYWMDIDYAGHVED